MTDAQFIPKPYTKSLNSGAFTWSSPSNIALVKYWGKRENQIPENPSISFTLNACKTTTTIHFSKKEDQRDFSFTILLDGKEAPDFKPKILTFFERVETYLPFLKSYHFRIETSNSFPHSSGIASSASGMSALALCLMSIEKAMSDNLSEADFIKKASFLARLGSGSACRSIEGDLVVWGEHEGIEGSSNLYGIKYPYEVHEVFKNYHDTILLVDKGEKQVSSTVGHNLMFGHPFAKQRFEQAGNNLSQLKGILKSGDLEGFMSLVEQEALTLHAMMMTSNPYFILMKPNTLKIINAIWAYREKTKAHLCFTLDAGANVHLLFPDYEAKQIGEFIKNELVAFCQNGHYISDRIGFGAKLL
ncbi:diphosphomevalonate/mevalonate 3,5-bisphosphate decarboxylase family protein [Gaetbulibacter aestuarii]|uniref:Diphosphomevalonate decarboxylase n=1 Tax=Gaetbulibacter aestuarii TaxID=1502358 RepID=A0ABW7N0V3_9FLAO